MRRLSGAAAGAGPPAPPISASAWALGISAWVSRPAPPLRSNQAARKVDGATTASAPLDVYALMEGFLVYPRKFDAVWLNSIMMLSSFAYENDRGVPRLAHPLSADEYCRGAILSAGSAMPPRESRALHRRPTSVKCEVRLAAPAR